MGIFNIFDNVGTKKKTEKFTASTTGIIIGLSSIKVNNKYLPLAEYVVNNNTYQIRVSYAIAKKMEKESKADYKIIEAKASNALNFKGQVTKLQGATVKIIYNPENPEESLVVQE